MAYTSQNPNGQTTASASSPVVLASDQTAIPPKTLSVTGSGGALNAAIIAVTDVSQYKWMSVQIGSIGLNNIVIEGSNDNVTYFEQPSQSTAGTRYDIGTLLDANVIYVTSIMTKYIRVRISNYLSGTVTANATFHESAATVFNINARVTPAGATAVTQSGSWVLSAGTANIGDVDVLTLPSLVAGTALIGKVGIDQTTPGTTNKVSIGTDGTVAVNTALPAGSNNIGDVDVLTLPAEGVVSSVNSSVATLAISGVFTGTSEDITNYSSVTIYVFSNVASATDGLSIQQSNDGTNWDVTDVYTVPAATGKTFGVQTAAKFFRVVYTNGGTIQASFRLQVIYHKYAQRTSSHRPQDARTNDNDFNETISYNSIYNGTTWDRLRGTNGAMNVDIVKKATYRASTTAVLVAAVTSPNPFFTIYGSATKTVRVQSIIVSGLTLTAVAYLNIGLRKYSTAVSGGTSTGLTKVPMDSSSAASTATNVNAYTAIPTAGATVGDISSRRAMGQATTAVAAGIPQIIDFDFSPTGDGTSIVLRGIAEGIGLYWITAPATAVSMLIRVEYTEE